MTYSPNTVSIARGFLPICTVLMSHEAKDAIANAIHAKYIAMFCHKHDYESACMLLTYLMARRKYKKCASRLIVEAVKSIDLKLPAYQESYRTEFLVRLTVCCVEASRDELFMYIIKYINTLKNKRVIMRKIQDYGDSRNRISLLLKHSSVKKRPPR